MHLGARLTEMGQAVAQRPRRLVAAMVAVAVVGGLAVLTTEEEDTSALRTEEPSPTSTTEDPSTTTSTSTTTAPTVPTSGPVTTAPSSTAPSPGATTAPTTAPPARRFVALGDDGLVSMRLDGSDRRSIATGPYREVELSPDGTWLLAIEQASQETLVSMDVDGGNVRTLPGSYQSPSVSPDGREIAAVRIIEGSGMELVRLNRDLSNPRVFPINHAPSWYYGSNQVEWAPVGGRLLITDSSWSRASWYDIATGTVHDTPIENGTAADPEVSPDGSMLAFHDRRHIVVVDLQSGVRREIAPYQGPLTWESSTTVLFSDGGTTYRVAATGGPVSVVCERCSHPAA